MFHFNLQFANSHSEIIVLDLLRNCYYNKKAAMERYRSGHNGADSKSVCAKAHAGSNPALSAKIRLKSPHFEDFFSILSDKFDFTVSEF